MDKLKAMQVFVQLVDVNGFSRAADVLDMSRGAVSRHVQDLEEWLGTTLINRTTRKMQITTSGAEFYEQARRILNEMIEVESVMSPSFHSPRGTLRLHTTGWLARHLVMPVLANFYAAHPEVCLSISVGEDQVGPMEKGVDCVLTTGEQQDSSNIARTLGGLEQVVVASPSYVRSNGTRLSKDDSTCHTLITTPPHDADRGNRGRPNTVLVVNDPDTALQASLQGLGIATLPRIIALPHLDARELLEVAGRRPAATLPVVAVLPPGRRVSPLSRAFMQWVASRFPDRAQTGQCMPPAGQTSHEPLATNAHSLANWLAA